MNKMIFVLIVLILSTLLLGCTQNTNNTNLDDGTNNTNINDGVDNMDEEVKSGDFISVNYTGKLENGEIFDTSVGREPLSFVAGAGQMIKGFDTAVIGMKVGDKKTITLTPQEAYGEINQEAIITVDKNQLPNFEDLKVGQELMSDNGARGRITELNDSNAVIDFNHFLAGKTLVFDIEIVSIGQKE